MPTISPQTRTMRSPTSRTLIGFLPQNNLEDPPIFDVENALEPNELDFDLDTLIPDSPNQPYDMHEVISRVLDDSDFLEVHALFAPNLVVGFGRIEGHSVGVVANQPLHFAGCLDIDASEKAARFVRTCDAFNVPVITFVDVPGFLPGTDQEMERHHPSRRKADLRLRRGDRSAGHGDHSQGVRWRVRRDGLQASWG